MGVRPSSSRFRKNAFQMSFTINGESPSCCRWVARIASGAHLALDMPKMVAFRSAERFLKELKTVAYLQASYLLLPSTIETLHAGIRRSRLGILILLVTENGHLFLRVEVLRFLFASVKYS